MSLKAATIMICLLGFGIPRAAEAGQPTEQIRTTVERALAILGNPQYKSEARTKERRSQLRQVLFVRFDFPEMAKRSLGSEWRRRTPQEQDEFVRLFSDLLERAYIGRIEAYNNEKFIYVKENLDKNYAVVESRILTHRGEEYSLNYKVHFVGGEWKIYDVVVENISLVNNYRSQFNRIITNGSFEELVRRLRDKQIEVAGERK